MKTLRLPKRLRLLPIVVIVGTPLLALKGLGLVHEARAQSAVTTAPQRSQKTDPTLDDVQMTSAAEVDVLTSLTKRRAKLDAETQEIALKENLLQATEHRIDDKIAQLKALETQIQQLLVQRDAEQQKQISALVKTYSAMKAKDAARIFDSLDDSVLVPVAKDMKPDVLAPILAAMIPDAAQKLTIKLANRLTLPDAPALPPMPAPAMSPPAAPGQPTVGATTTAPAAPPSGQTAQTTPAGAPTSSAAAPATPPAPAQGHGG